MDTLKHAPSDLIWAARHRGVRPVLTDAQAARFTRQAVLALTGPAGQERYEPWTPAREIRSDPCDYLVDPEAAAPALGTVQEAVDAAIRSGKTGRVIIDLAPGTYHGLVYLPKVQGRGLAFTLRGRGATPQDVEITAAIDAEMPGAEYQTRFGAAFETAARESRAIFARIAARETLSTANASVIRTEADDTELFNLTIRNAYNADRAAATPEGFSPDAMGRYPRGQHQAVAFLSAGADRVVLGHVHLKSYQDTLYLQAPDKFSTVRSYLFDCDIEGDVDFIFGQSTAYFEGCTLRALGARGARCWVTAPSTHIRTPFGFVFEDCDFVDDGAAPLGRVHLGRQWFEAVKASPYGTPPVAGYAVTLGPVSYYTPPKGEISEASLFSVGKCVLLNCRIGPQINRAAPWDDWSGPGYAADGALLPGPWQPRYRPHQIGPSDFKRFLSNWPELAQVDLSDLDPEDIWLGEYNTMESEARHG
ncbi:pectinesterase family protein [Paracoccaceae bacterium GXU_MW_L88]